MAICPTPFGDLSLARYPSRSREPLRAWCSADLLLLEAVAEQSHPGSSALVVNDAHGILCLALGAAQLWTDSALSAAAMRNNAESNGLLPTPVIWSTQTPPSASLVVMRVPKQRAFFVQQLQTLAQCLPCDAVVLAAGMDKHLSPATAQLLETYIGPTRRHPGRKKARVFSAVRDSERQVQPQAAAAGYYCSEIQGTLTALPNVFSGDKLDGGARLLLQHLDKAEPAHSVIDLACGNGVLGLAVFKHGLGKQVVFCDESAQAIASAQRNAIELFPAEVERFSFHHGDGVPGTGGTAVGTLTGASWKAAANSSTGTPAHRCANTSPNTSPDTSCNISHDTQAQLIVCNPPFHLEHAVDEYAGRRLLQQCAEYLGADGQLLLVANRHLDYLPTLKRGFGSVRLLDEDRRFRLWLARKQSRQHSHKQGTAFKD